MIKQCAVSDIESRSECNPYNSEGFLPIITSPMYSVVNEDNVNIFLENKVQVCLPRNIGTIPENGEYFVSYSLNDFIKNYITQYEITKMSLTFVVKVCIDTAAGHLKSLHEAIRKAKAIHGDNLIIMAGNVSSVEAFVELAKTGVDYIRVGIGGGGGCNTASNTGVGQKNLAKLIKACIKAKGLFKEYCLDTYLPYKEYAKKHGFVPNETKQRWSNVSKVKIVADGISYYVKQCETKYGFNDNGYAAINTLIYAGADIVMIGKLFVQCLESAGEKGVETMDGVVSFDNWLTPFYTSGAPKSLEELFNRGSKHCRVRYSGMSTLQEQEKYKDGKWGVYKNSRVPNSKHPYKDQIFDTEQEAKDYAIELSKGNPVGFTAFSLDKKPSEGSVQWIPVRFFLKEWLLGNNLQDNYPYLMGFTNSLKSAMSYVGANSLNAFKNGK